MKPHVAMFVMIAAAFVARASAGVAADEEENPTIQIRLHPAAAPCAALKYALLPPILDRRPGNAITQYLKAPSEYSRMYADEKLWDKLQNWMEMPLPELRGSGGSVATTPG